MYVTNMSLDGYVKDLHGSNEWAAPSGEVFTLIAEGVGLVGTPLRTANVRNDGRVEDVSDFGKAIGAHGKGCEHLAGYRQDCLLHEPAKCLDHQHAN